MSLKDSPLIIALDVKWAEALDIAKSLDPQICKLKIGSQLFTSVGPESVRKLSYLGFDIFLDLKFHDLPTTVYKAVKVVNSLKVNYLSIHSLGGNNMINAATKASNFTKILSVSLLSHHDQKSINDIGIKQPIQNQIKKLILNALKNNVFGLILAPKDLDIARKIKKKIIIFVPGIRGKKNRKDEHKRSLDPLTAIKKGATYIIIGRPITKSKNPKETLKLINEEIKNYLKKKL